MDGWKNLEEEVDGDILFKKEQKSDHSAVIPLRFEAKKILDNRFNNNAPSPTNVEFNRHIKKIAELAGIPALQKPKKPNFNHPMDHK